MGLLPEESRLVGVWEVCGLAGLQYVGPTGWSGQDEPLEIKGDQRLPSVA